jgi:hypothetical protein
MMNTIDTLKLALEALEAETDPNWECNSYHPKIWEAITAIKQALAAPVPEGWKLVPIEPTDEMLDAAQAIVVDIYRVDADRVYAAMLKNVPKKGQP